MTSMLNTLLVVGFLAVLAIKRCDWLQICGNIGDELKTGSSSGGGGSSEYKSSKGGKGKYKAPKGKGGYIGTPGWYTISGHHHCNMGESGCVCTDPKKCCKTGYPPRNDAECRPDLDRYGAKPKSLCNCAKGASGGKTKGYYSRIAI